jgi:hypothetical protein
MCCKPNFCEGALLGQNRFRVELQPNTRQSPTTTRCRLNIGYRPCSCWTTQKRGVRNCGVSRGREAEESKSRQTKLSTLSIHFFLGFLRQLLRVLQVMPYSSPVGAVRACKLLFSTGGRAVVRGPLGPPKISLSEFDLFNPYVVAT